VPILVHTGAEIVPAEQATIPILDHGFLFGDSVYEVVRSAGGKPFLLREHLVRLRASGRRIYFEVPWPDEEIARRMEALTARLPPVDLYFRIVATRGPGPLSLLPDGCDRPGLYILARELEPYPARLYTEGCKVAVVPRLRNDPRAMDPAAKTGNYLNNLLGLVEARRMGADDALFLNAEGRLTESTTSNVWIVEGGRALTPPLGEGLLAGITRDWLLEMLPRAGVPVEEAVIDRARLDRAEEVFLTGTVKGVMPVSYVDGRRVCDEIPGPVTRRAAALYAAALRGEPLP
jgi:branched-chain amino acid aminotransferase